MSGTLVLVVGASGAGKDTLLNAARGVLRNEPGFVFARRIVTRPSVAELEDHDTLGADAFAVAEAEGRFLLSWRANNLAYALPGALADDLAAGRTVVANVSRGVIAAAEALAGRTVVVHVVAPPDVRAARLAGRGREEANDIAARLAREAPLRVAAAPVIEVRNDGAIEDGVRAMLDALIACLPAAPAEA